MTEQRRQAPPLPTRRSGRPPPQSGTVQAPVVTDERSEAAGYASESVGTLRESVPSVLPPPPERTAVTEQESHEPVVRPDPSALPALGSAELWGGKLRVTEELDRGGMSYVLRGTDTTLCRELALKVSPLPRDRLPRAQLARFIEEAQITAQLEHPNVVPLHELGVDPDGRMYFTMKLVRGQSLESILEKRRQGDAKTRSEFGLRRLLDVFLQVCQAIEYAHARGVIHRDLKPGNIMVGDFGEVLVMDWGVAKVIGRAAQGSAHSITTTGSLGSFLGGVEGSLPPPPPDGSVPPVMDVTSVRAGKKALATQAGALIGTPAYMSPEQAQGLPVDERSDLYALGVILYEILCDMLPFDDDDPSRLLLRMLREPPPRPSSVERSTPLALETLALRLLEKDPERRTLTLAQIRAHVQNYIEGMGRDYRRQSLWSNVLWILGGLSLFAFLVWYLTGRSIAALFVLAPAPVFNSLGWFLVVVALGTPLWAAYLSLRPRAERDLFQAPTTNEVFTSGYLAHRTFAAAVAPIFQLVFIVEVISLAIARASRGEVHSAELVQRITTELRAEWAQSLVVILIFLFAYLFFLSAEVRFARLIDRYDLLVARPRWEAIWPFFLIIVLLLSIGTTTVLDWALAPGGSDFLTFARQQVFTQPLDLIEIGKTLVFQGTFLMGLVFATLLLAFPFAEVLGALRLAYQPADEASVLNRSQYFLRSLAIFRVLRVNCLYGGAMIGGLTAMTILSQPTATPLVKQALYILGPSLIGFVGYSLTRGHVTSFLAHAPFVVRMLEQQVTRSQIEQARANAEELARAPWRHRLLQLIVPVACIMLYLVWTGSGVHQRALQQLMIPVTTKGWLLILPYVLLVPVLLTRDQLQLARVRRRLAESP